MCGNPRGSADPTENGDPRPSGGRASRPGPPLSPWAPRPKPPPHRPRGFKSGARPGQCRPTGPGARPAVPYLGSGQCGPARSGEFADSGQSTRTGSGGRVRRTEAQRERLTDPGNGLGACAGRPRGGLRTRLAWERGRGPAQLRRGGSGV